MTSNHAASKIQFPSIHELESFLWRGPKQDVAARSFVPELAEWLDDGGLNPEDNELSAVLADASAAATNTATLLVVGRESASSSRARSGMSSSRG